jgi:hypothetical protein
VGVLLVGLDIDVPYWAVLVSRQTMPTARHGGVVVVACWFVERMSLRRQSGALVAVKFTQLLFD